MKNSVIFFITVLFIGAGCQSDLPDRNVLVRKYYDQKVNTFIKEKDDACKSEILELAENKMDSVIDQYVKKNLIDSNGFPSKPTKPKRPDHIINKVQKFNVDSLTTRKNIN
ncbi:MAG: hypothetical protein HKO66_09045 [Saprospiraceae bacterium]|nr:hypothetical protein [Bacteroidia bacterium]NNE16658.1 hypothetical protein [Saprospiraceae bacterium]NNL92363.1 hypothetical protein [Saprospiraceae bacterium]